jgi:hypothetical protein
MYDLGTQLNALWSALSCLEDVEGVLIALAVIVVLWMVRHEWESMAPHRRH